MIREYGWMNEVSPLSKQTNKQTILCLYLWTVFVKWHTHHLAPKPWQILDLHHASPPLALLHLVLFAPPTGQCMQTTTKACSRGRDHISQTPLSLFISRDTSPSRKLCFLLPRHFDNPVCCYLLIQSHSEDVVDEAVPRCCVCFRKRTPHSLTSTLTLSFACALALLVWKTFCPC